MDEPFLSAVRDALEADPEGFSITRERPYAVTLSDGAYQLEIETERYYSASTTIVLIDPAGERFRLRTIQEVLDPAGAEREMAEGRSRLSELQPVMKGDDAEQRAQALYAWNHLAVSQALAFLGAFRAQIFSDVDHFREACRDADRQLMERLTQGKPIEGWRPTIKRGG